jgi:phosphoheptose isomerase
MLQPSVRDRAPLPRRVLVAVLLVAAAPAHGTDLRRLGSEFQVNIYTTSSQSVPSVSLDADGDFIVAWRSNGQDGSLSGVFARRFNAAGVAQGSEFQVNTYTTSYQSLPSVSLDADGDFVVAWQSYGQDGSSYGVFARRFSAAGVAQAGEFQVSSDTTSVQSSPSVSLDADGDFVVAWHSFARDGSSYGVFARRFSAAGVAQASEFQVNAYTTNGQDFASVSLDADGDFVVAWRSSAQDGSGYGVFARRFNAAGAAQGGEFQVNTYTTDSQSRPSVSLDDGGDFVVAWQSNSQDGSDFGVFARRFSAAGAAQTGEFQVSTHTTNNQSVPSVSLDADGDFVVAWESLGQDGSDFGVFARRFSAAGVAQGGEFGVNAYTTNGQLFPSVSLDADGAFVVAWQSFGQDGSSYGVVAQRFAPLAVLDIDGDGETGALTDGLLVLRYLFGFTGATLVAGAIDAANCTRCDAAAIEAYLQTLI